MRFFYGKSLCGFEKSIAPENRIFPYQNRMFYLTKIFLHNNSNKHSLKNNNNNNLKI